MTTKYTIENLEDEYGRLTFADLLLIQREDQELTQIEMSKKLGISRQKLCDFEKGRRVPSLKIASTWAKKLKQPHDVWIQVLLQDLLEKENLNLKVSIAS